MTYPHQIPLVWMSLFSFKGEPLAIFKRVLNNNTAIATNHDGINVLVMGSGLGFGSKAGQQVPLAKVEKTFLLKDKNALNRFTDLVLDVPMSIIDDAERIINYAKIKLGRKLNDIIYVNLTDHLDGAVKRARKDIFLTNALKWDIARFYPDEFAVGQKAVEIVNKAEKVDLGEDEAAFIAIHFVNVETDGGAEQDLAYETTKIVKACEDIVKDYFHTEFDEQSLDYYRFITHLKFFGQRVLQGKHYDEDDSDLLATMKVRYAKPYACVQQIQAYILKTYRFKISSSELLFLTVHISRLVKNL